MRTVSALAFFAFYSLVISCTQAQTSSLFESYDCRSEVEIIRMLDQEKRQQEQARLDSIRIAEQQVARAALQPERHFTEDTVNGWKCWTLARNFDFGKDRGNLPMITSLEALHPYFRDKILQLISLARSKGIELAVVETYRTHAKQNEYKTMGKKFTRMRGGSSKHQYGLAVDLVPMVNGQPQWHNMQLWRKVGVMGERLGLRWGGRWRSPFDPGHFEWTAGFSPEDLAKGKMPLVPKQETLYPCLEDDLKLLRKYWNEWEASQSALARQQQ